MKFKSDWFAKRIQINNDTKMHKKIFIIMIDTFEISLSYILYMHYSMYNISVFKIVDELKRKKKEKETKKI